MKTQNIYHLLILDASGSMECIKESTITGFNEVVQTIQDMEKQFPEQRHFVSLTVFNGNGIRTLMDKAAVKQLKELTPSSYQPRSSTPLYDAIGLSVSRLRYDVEDKEAKFLVTILTDGEENASQEYSWKQVNGMINELKEHGWTFTYIGANHDVEQAAATLSITNTLCFSANEADVKRMFEQEKKSRMAWSRKVRDNENLQEGYFEEKGL